MIHLTCTRLLLIEGVEGTDVTGLSSARIPITETGYRSHFLHLDEITEFGGPVAYVEAWLNEMARTSEWQSHVASGEQLSLF